MSGTSHRWVVGVMLAIVVTSVGVWWSTRDRLPREIRIATAEPGGQYHRLATVLGDVIAERTGHAVRLVTSRGSVDNFELLKEGRADLAILQSASVPLRELSVIAPLYTEPILVVVREGARIRRVQDLPGHAVAVGRPGSGMRETARALLAHYRIAASEIEQREDYFLDLATDASLEAAIVTTGIGNPDLELLCAQSDLALLPILDAESIAMRNPYFYPFTVPRGLFGERPALPAGALPTVATTAVLAADREVGDALVSAVVGALYETNLLPEFPMLISELEALARTPVPLHGATRRYLDPYQDLSRIANLLESLAGIKELLFGVAALGYLVWDRVHRRRAKEREATLSVYKERLDVYLDRTAAIERAQMKTTDLATLSRHLDEVTEIKLKALEELSHEDLRGDRMFLIFLTQCANLIRKIQTKILYYDRVGARADDAHAAEVDEIS